jgi:hypothetical protein
MTDGPNPTARRLLTIDEAAAFLNVPARVGVGGCSPAEGAVHPDWQARPVSSGRVERLKRPGFRAASFAWMPCPLIGTNV